MVEKAPGRHYFDWAAAAIPDETLTKPASGSDFPFANPSSLHLEGRQARQALEDARNRCAALLGVEAQTLYFSSGGTESNALVLHAQIRHQSRGALLYSAIEHPSVRENCLVLGKLGLPVSAIPAGKDGRISEAALEKALSKNPGARFITIMGVNNETGSINNIEALVKVAREEQKKGGPAIHVHSDLVQALGKIPIDLKTWDLDSASFSAHKLGGPRGIGLLYLRKPLQPLYTGGEQERNVRPGTENTQGAAMMAEILQKRISPQALEEESEKARQRMAYLLGALREVKDSQGRLRCRLIPEDRQDQDPRFSPWIVQVRFKDVPGAVMVRALDEAGVAVSTGSACSSASEERPVLAAMGLDESARLEGIRISQGWSTTKDDLDALILGVEKVLTFL
ncbi:MAG: cysteine desulfurase [Treponema sp.]|nr:cysteine desulfurase [Treponema sp.]